MVAIFKNTAVMAMALALSACNTCAFTKADADRTGKALWPNCVEIKSPQCKKDVDNPSHCPGGKEP